MDQLTGMRVFVRVAELNSFSRAAEDLEIAQSTVTKTVAWLENRLGTRLINRNTRGLTLNEAGKLYYETCRAILRQIEEAEGLVRRHDAELDGTLRISTSVAFGEAVLGPMLLPFIAANRGCGSISPARTLTSISLRAASTWRCAWAASPTRRSAGAISAPTPG